MNLNKIKARRTSALLASLLAGASFLGAADDAAKPAAPAGTTVSSAASQNEEIARLQAALAAQQKQLEALQKAIEEQQKMLQSAIASPAVQQAAKPAALGTVASLAPVVPAPASAPFALPATPAPKPQAAPAAGGNPCEAPPDANAVPPFLRIGNACVIPNGFMDLIGEWRDKNGASGIGTNYGSIPYNNVTAGKLSEVRLSPQNSRLGFRADGNWNGAHFIIFNEFDFLGTSGTNNLGVTNGAFVPRLRLFWGDVRKGKIEVLGGQSWSLLTPNQRGVGGLPTDLAFINDDIDVNYFAGLTWTRQAGIRFMYHPSNKVAFAFAAENPDQQIGGSGGLSATAVTLPAASALSGIGGSQVDNTSNVLNTPNLAPDFIAKVAFDPSSKFHFEVAGLDRTFKIYDSATNTYSTKTGAGVLVGGNVEVFKGFRLLTSNFWSDGGGRYLFGEAPDFIVRADGTVSPIRAGGTLEGFEATVGNFYIYGDYGAYYAARNTALDANGTTRIGFGFTGSSNSDNRAMNEVTFGANHTIWRNPRYGGIMMRYQYAWIDRDPWYVAPGSPKATHDNTIFVGLRYYLPGSMPNF